MGSNNAWKWVGIAHMLIIGVIHLIEAPDQFGDATYKGILFLLAFAGGMLAAIGIWRAVPYSWAFGALVALCCLVGYVWSRTIGLPFLPVDHEYIEFPFGIGSVIAEVCYLVLAALRIKAAGWREPASAAL